MRKSDHKFHLFLTELVISLTLFVVCAAVCAALLVHARAMSTESRRLTEAVCLAQGIAEDWRATKRPPSAKDTTPNEGGLTVATVETGDGLDVAVYYGDELIYELKGVRRLG